MTDTPRWGTVHHPSPSFFQRLFHPVSLQERINFARHLSVGIKSGLPLLESLRLIQRQTGSGRFARIIESIAQHVHSGQSLAESLDRFNYVFGDLFVNMVRVGETSGNQKVIKAAATVRSRSAALAHRGRGLTEHRFPRGCESLLGCG